MTGRAGKVRPAPRADAAKHRILDVTVLLLDGGYASTAIGPIEVFHSAGVIWNWLRGEQQKPRFRVRVASIDGKPVTSFYGLQVTPACALSDIRKTDIVIVPTSGWDIVDRIARTTPLLPWLRKWHDRGAIIAGVMRSGPADKAGVKGRWSVPIQAALPPVADFDKRCAGLLCTFDAHASHGDQGIKSYQWTFADGQTASGVVVTRFMHGYSAENVQLRVVDDLGQSGSTSRQVLPAENTVAPRFGLYQDPARPGTLVDFEHNSDGDWVLFWYTYEKDGSPVWYYSPVAKVKSASLSSALVRVTWNGGPVQKIVGKVGLAFSDPTTAWFSWELAGESGGQRIEFVSGGEGRSGAWYNVQDSGWGVQLQEQGGNLVATAAVYDANGQPRWVQGRVGAGGDVMVPMSYFTGMGLCPSCAGNAPPVAQPAGSIRLVIADGAVAMGSISTAIAMPIGAWSRPLVPVARLTAP